MEETRRVEEKRRSVRSKKLSTADEQYLKVMSLRKRKRSSKDLRDASGPSADPSTAHWSLIRNGLHGRVAVKKPFLWKGNGEKRLSYAKWISGLDCMLTTGLIEGRILPRPRNSTLLKQCGIILMENWTKGSQQPKKSFEMFILTSRSLENYSWRLLKEMTESLSKTVKE